MAAPSNHRRRTVVTGQGMVTPLGRTPRELWSRWAAGRPAAGPLSKIDLRFFGCTAAAEVKDFEPRKEIRNRKLLRLLIDGEPFGFVAAVKALEDAGLTPADYDPDRAGIALGCHKEGFRNDNLYDALDAAQQGDGSIDRKLLIEEGIRRIPPQTLVEGLANAALYYLAHEFDLRGVHHNFISSGTGGSQAAGEAMRSIRRGEADVMLAGGYDTFIDWRCVAHLGYAGVISESSEPPEFVHKPFDCHRAGGVIGEGAGMLVLEERQRAIERRAHIFGEILAFAMGTGLPSDGRDVQAEIYARLIGRALADAGCTSNDIDLVHLHGEGTPDGDWIEATAVRQALGDRAAVVPVTTVKSATGLLGNASGPVELVMTLEMLRRGEVLPIVNLQDADADFDLNFVREPLTGLTFRRALVLQHSLPMHLTALVVGTGGDGGEHLDRR